MLENFLDVPALFQNNAISQPTSAPVLHFSYASFSDLGHTDDIKESQAKGDSGPRYPSGAQKHCKTVERQ